MSHDCACISRQSWDIRASVLQRSCEFYFLAIKSQNGLNRAYPESTNFKTFVPRNLKFYTFGDLHTTKKCWKFQLDILKRLRVIATRKYNKHIAKYWGCTWGGYKWAIFTLFIPLDYWTESCITCPFLSVTLWNLASMCLNSMSMTVCHHSCYVEFAIENKYIFLLDDHVWKCQN